MYMHVRAVFNPSKGGVHTSRKGVYSFIPGVRLNIPTPLVQQVKRELVPPVSKKPLCQAVIRQ